MAVRVGEPQASGGLSEEERWRAIRYEQKQGDQLGTPKATQERVARAEPHGNRKA